MTRPLGLLFLVIVAVAPALGQGSAYSLDNFDMRNGVRIQLEPTPTPVSRRSRRRSAPPINTPIAVQAPVRFDLSGSDSLSSLVRPTSLAHAGGTPAPAGSIPALRGYTTGSSDIDTYLVESGTRNGVDPLLLYSVMHQESSFKYHAISPKGARGLMQLMPPTAMRFGVTNIFDPRQNIEGGARYMAFLLDRFNNDVSLALAGYNAGEGAVEKYGWRIPPYSETQEYVRRITRRYDILRDPNAAFYAPRISRSQVAAIRNKKTEALTIYERSVSTVRLPDGRLQLSSQ